MTKSRLMAGASRFAHFSGLTRAAARRAAEDDRRDDETSAEDDEDEERAEEDDDAPEPKGKKGRKAKAAEDDDADEDGEDEPKGKKGRKAKAAEDDEDGDDTDDEPKARGKKSRRAEDDDDGSDAEEDDDDKEMTGRSAVASARRRERARCAAIFAHSAAANNVALAASLAFETTMTRKEAIAVLKGQEGRSADAPAPGARASRESRNANLGGGDHRQRQVAGASWDRSLAKLGIKPRQA